MIIDIKTHIISLIAVFLALGVGIFVGSIVVGGDTLQEAQEKMVARLEQDVDNLMMEIKAASRQTKLMRENLKTLIGLDETVISRAVKKYSGEQRLFLLALDGEFEDEVLSKLGLSHEFMALFPDDSGLDDKRLIAVVKVLTQFREEGGTQTPQVFTPLPEKVDLNRMALGIRESLGQGRPVLLLFGSGLVSRCGVTMDTLLRVRQLASEIGIRLAVVSTSVSALPLDGKRLGEIGISSVDCVDLPAGRLALALIADGDSGNFSLGRYWVNPGQDTQSDEPSDGTDW
ncbi:MAG TPA: copper transporter [Clostridia bacterium]|nr:copper transporter [Clostridia bacterium]